MRREFRIGWLLLLLRGGPGYGYDLRRELVSRALEIDRAMMYRTLRTMEHSGLIISRWARSQAGPRRRVYELCQAGHSELHRIAEELSAARDAHTKFLDAYEALAQEQGPPAEQRG